ncbi:MAG: hypothetical protein H7346_06850, partial [Burkholderiaceae bacterium]|nr:hypothetical protein [Burkholderiaceae bacterium]
NLAYGPGGGADEAAQSLNYTVSAVPSAALGSVVLADGTTVVVAGNSYSLADLQGMGFLAAANANGGPATFSWTVQDNAGTANGGANTLTQSLTISVTAVNDAPVQTAGSINNLSVLEDAGATSLGLANLAYGPGGGADEAAQSLSYTVSAVPPAGLGRIVLGDGSQAVAGGSYTLFQLQGAQFVAAGAVGGPASFSWVVADNQGVANGGADHLDQSIMVNVMAAPSAPAAPPAPAVAAPAASSPAPAPVPSSTSDATLMAPETLVPVTAAAAPAPAPVASQAPEATQTKTAAPAVASTQTAATGDRNSGAEATLLDDSQRQLAQALGVQPLQDFGRPASGLVSFGIQPVVIPALSLDRRDVSLPQQALAQEAGPLSIDVRMPAATAASADMQRTFRSPVFVEKLDRMREDVRKELNLDKTVALSAGAVSFGVSLIYVLWLIRGGVLMGSYLSAMPAWRVLDPLPVLPNSDAGTDEDDDSLEAAIDDPGDPLHSLRGY